MLFQELNNSKLILKRINKFNKKKIVKKNNF